ncbi:Os08g0431601 [Oryza sativa Japonica Group]|uniref:Os08g0431601 protein n=2 Tax=Oryza TaxID=4527 RepID=C7J611_ORYSJ|nr:Os08g0431601 [Oryza sativa Japonica Group]|eukprot:NP_001175593.1 Os08g0431601 [Oryza sativa Japonica Group]
MTRSRPTPPARWGRPLDRGAAADQPPRIALFDLVNHDGAAPASRYTLSVAFGDEGLRGTESVVLNG